MNQIAFSSLNAMMRLPRRMEKRRDAVGESSLGLEESKADKESWERPKASDSESLKESEEI